MDSNTTHTRFRLFNGADEFINLIWPFVWGGILIAIGATLTEPIETMSGKWIYVLTGALFLNVTHNVFSVFILLWIPEVKNSLLSDKKKYIFWATLFVMFVLLLIYFSMVVRGYYSAILLALFFDYIAFFHHIIRQISGISGAYQKGAELAFSASHEVVTRSLRSQSRERLLFFLLHISCGIGLYLRLSQTQWGYEFIGLAAALCTGGILVNSLMAPFGRRSNKTIYLTRLVFFPLSFWFPIAFLGPHGFHGVEYFFVFRKMWQKSRLRMKRLDIWWKIFLPISILVGCLCIFREKTGPGIQIKQMFPTLTPLFAGLGVISLAFGYLHFYMDFKIFRMKDQKVKENVGPLLL